MTVLCILLLALALIVLAPFRLRARGHSGGGREPALEIRLRPWIGFAGFRLFYADGGWRAGVLLGWWAVGALSLTTEEGRKKKRSGGEPVRKGGEADPDGFPETVERLARAGIYIKRQWTPMRRFAVRILNGFRLRRITCRVVYGASDPAVTGQIFGYSMAASSLVGARGYVDVTPDFTRRRLDGDAEVEIRIYPHRLLWAFACIGWCAGLVWISERRNRKRPEEGMLKAGATGS